MYSGLPRRPSFEEMLVHEERQLVAISKPAGLLSQRDHTGEASAICMAADWLASTARPGRAHLVHRLDRRATGLLLIARSTKAASRMSASFAQRAVAKTYLALCERGTKSLAAGAEGRLAATLRFDQQRRRAVPVATSAASAVSAEAGRGNDARSVSLGYSVLGVQGEHALLAVRPVSATPPEPRNLQVWAVAAEARGAGGWACVCVGGSARGSSIRSERCSRCTGCPSSETCATAGRAARPSRCTRRRCSCRTRSWRIPSCGCARPCRQSGAGCCRRARARWSRWPPDGSHGTSRIGRLIPVSLM